MEKIKEMSIDLETYSDVDIKKSGVYKYAESENFEILLFEVSINGGDVIVYDLACGDVLPDEILNAIVSDDVIKWAFNASFERICLSYWMKRYYPDRFCVTASLRTQLAITSILFLALHNDLECLYGTSIFT